MNSKQLLCYQMKQNIILYLLLIRHKLSLQRSLERNLIADILLASFYIYLHSTEFLLICSQFNDVTAMVFCPETRRSRHTADKAISRKLGFMSKYRVEGNSSDCIRRLQVKFSTTGIVMFIQVMSKSLRIKQTFENVFMHASIIFKLYSFVNGPLQIAVNLTVTSFFIQILDLGLFICFKLAKIHNIPTFFHLCNLYRVNYW